jgi:hypothetical protein
MAQSTGDRVSSAGGGIPMRKAGITTYLAIGVGVLAIGAVVGVSLSGGDEEAEKKAAAIKASANKRDAPQMTAKEQREHMKMTALALERAEANAKAKKAEAAERQAAKAERTAPVAQAPAAGEAAPAAAPAPKKPVNNKAAKKELDSLDSMGSDIATALE